MSSSNPIIPRTTAHALGLDGAAEIESALLQETSVPMVGNAVVWGIVSDFNLWETCRTFAVVVAAFKKLGKVELAADLLSRARNENFEFKDDHLNKNWEQLLGDNNGDNEVERKT